MAKKIKEIVVAGEFETMCHYISYRFWNFKAKDTPELHEYLKESALERARECISEGYREGQLNCLWNDEEIRGWWEILKD